MYFFKSKHVKISEIVERLKYFDKKRLIFAKGARGANENPQKATYTNKIEPRDTFH